MVEIKKIKGDWSEVLDDCRATVGKEMTGKDPSKNWVKKILISEHDPIRDIEVKFSIKNLPYWVAMHLKTHIWRSRTNSQRNDRQSDYDRNEAPQGMPVNFIGDANVQHLIDTSRKRLCYMASPETRKVWEELKIAIGERDAELTAVLVPNCVYRCGCPELRTCGYFARMVEQNPDVASTDIQRRYDAYNSLFKSER